MKVRDVIRLIEEDGWVRVQMRGDHRLYKHPMKRGRVTIAGHPSDDVHAKTLQSILTQAGLRRRNP
jgi:predicted RNA binding protein YcfA (HicA-like mRNA interferase family)